MGNKQGFLLQFVFLMYLNNPVSQNCFHLRGDFFLRFNWIYIRNVFLVSLSEMLNDSLYVKFYTAVFSLI